MLFFHSLAASGKCPPFQAVIKALKAMRLALFDLDHTLLDGDTDELWGRFLVDEGLHDEAEWSRQRARHVADYRAGTLDVGAFIAYAMRPLLPHPLARLHALRDRFVGERLLPALHPAGRDLVRRHRDRGHRVVIATATNRLLVEPLAEALGAEALLGSRPEMRDGRLTGRLEGEPCFRQGKLNHVRRWAGDESALRRAWFYSDSHNDLPLLEAVGHPVAVDPEPRLRARAEAAGWPVISLRQPAPA